MPTKSFRRPRALHFAWKPILVAALFGLAFAAGAFLLQAQVSLSELEIRFPDGTVQRTAAHNCFNPDNPADEMIRVGGVCIDKYEASIWNAPVGGSQIVGSFATDYCNPNGQDCTDIYARSVPDVEPAANITWFQAQQALANSGKRLPTNAEWQMAVRGTPDSSLCNVSGAAVMDTGALESCVSDWGAFDMVGNVWEWVADWNDEATTSTNWPSTFGSDLSGFGLGATETNSHLPGALTRGGSSLHGSGSGPFAVLGGSQPLDSDLRIGFRGAR